MAEHEHTRTIHLYHVELPYGLDGQSLTFEADGADASLLTELEELAEWSDEELKRVITAAAALLAKFPHRTAEAAIGTAMIWERG